MTSPTPYAVDTLAIHAGEPDGQDVAAPLHLSTSFAYDDAEEAAHAFAYEDRPIYTRWGNPTLARLEAKVAALEGAEAGLAAASGMAAIATALLGTLKAGDHLIATSGLYSGTHHLVSHNLPALGIETTIVPAADTAAFEAAIRPTTRALYLESPSNPTFALNDIAAIAAVAQARGLVTLIDNTFATPINQQPHTLGVDIVVHSATKYLCGHGDAIGGMITGSAEHMERLRRDALRNFGGTMNPFNAWLIARGVQTLPLRVARHNASALALATWLAEHPAVAWVRYPYQPSHPQYDLALRQMRGGGGVLVFELKGGLEAGRRIQDRVMLCRRAVSLGDVKSLITHPASTTHASLGAEARQAAGLSDGLVRLAVGLEDVEDIQADLERGLG